MSSLKWDLKTPVLVCLYLSIYSSVDSVGMEDGWLYTKQTRTSKSVRSGGGHFWDNILFNSETVKGRKETSKAQVLLSECPDPLRCTARNFCNDDMVMSSQAENNLNFQTDERGFISCVSSSAQLLGVCCQLQDEVGKLRSDISVDLLNSGQRMRNPFVVINVSQESFSPPNRNINSGELSRIQGTLETRVKAAMAMNALRSILGNSGSSLTTRPQKTEVFTSCPAAMLCVKRDRCDGTGVISEIKFRNIFSFTESVPLIVCDDPNSDEVDTVCCRDPNYQSSRPDYDYDYNDDEVILEEEKFNQIRKNENRLNEQLNEIIRANLNKLRALENDNFRNRRKRKSKPFRSNLNYRRGFTG